MSERGARSDGIGWDWLFWMFGWTHSIDCGAQSDQWLAAPAGGGPESIEIDREGLSNRLLLS